MFNVDSSELRLHEQGMSIWGCISPGIIPGVEALSPDIDLFRSHHESSLTHSLDYVR